MSEALAIAEQYARSVTNAMTVQGSQQVMLQVKFAEVSRNVVRQLGIGHDLAVTGDLGFDLITSSALPLATGSLPFGSARSPPARIRTRPADNLPIAGAERPAEDLGRTNLIALSGDTANFLAGGEFPIPVDQDDNTITVEFKEFGVGLSFHADCDRQRPHQPGRGARGQPDRSHRFRSTDDDGVGGSGPVDPRAKTTIELRDGQSFAIAGLLQEDYQNAISGLPWLADIPILGLLFRSTGFQRNETELVILVTPRLVKPAQSMAELTTPTDRLVLPSDTDFSCSAGPRAKAPAPLRPRPECRQRRRRRRVEPGAGRLQPVLRLHHRVRGNENYLDVWSALLAMQAVVACDPSVLSGSATPIVGTATRCGKTRL